MLKARKWFPPTRVRLRTALALTLLAGAVPAAWAQNRHPPENYLGRGCLDYDFLPYLHDSPPDPSVSRRYVAAEREAPGGLDLNVEPRDTEVFLNGYLIGTAGDFDGWPRYLWLAEDVHELLFYKEGYETVVREIAVERDVVVDVELPMQPGPSTRPEELTRHRDRDFDDSSRDPREDDDDRAPDDGFDPATHAGRLVLQVSPPEASIYIDGQFVGIGAMLTEIEDGLLMDEGEHRIEVFHPRFGEDERSFTVTAGEQTQLVITLESAHP